MDNTELYLKKLTMHHMMFESIMDNVISDLKRRTKKHNSGMRTGIQKTVFSKYIKEYPNVFTAMRGKHAGETVKIPDELKIALKLHAKENDYMPTHEGNQLDTMKLPQLIEFCVELVTSAKELGISKNELDIYIKTNFQYNYGISEQLLRIIANTVDSLYEEYDEV